MAKKNIKPESLDKYYAAIPKLRQGKSLTKSAKEVGTTPKTFRKINAQFGHAVVKEKRPGKATVYEIPVGRAVTVILAGNKPIADRLAIGVELDEKSYQRFLVFMDAMESGKTRSYPQFTVFDMEGVKYRLSVKPSDYTYAMQELGGSEVSDFTDFFYPERWG